MMLRSSFLRFLPLLLPLAPLLFFGAARFTGWQETGSKHDANSNSNGFPAWSLVEFNRERSVVDRANETEACLTARKVVEERLIPPHARPLLDNSDLDTTPETVIRPVSVIHPKPHLYRVRGTVIWREASGMVRRRFEADVRHGPVGDQWTLVDTEFLAEGTRSSTHRADENAGEAQK